MNVLVIKPDHLSDCALALPALFTIRPTIGPAGRLQVLTLPPSDPIRSLAETPAKLWLLEH